MAVSTFLGDALMVTFTPNTSLHPKQVNILLHSVHHTILLTHLLNTLVKYSLNTIKMIYNN